jgi:hypothetical protein
MQNIEQLNCHPVLLHDNQTWSTRPRPSTRLELAQGDHPANPSFISIVPAGELKEGRKEGEGSGRSNEMWLAWRSHQEVRDQMKVQQKIQPRKTGFLLKTT